MSNGKEIATKKLNPLTLEEQGPGESQELLWTHLKAAPGQAVMLKTSRPSCLFCPESITVSFCPGKCALEKLRYGLEEDSKPYSENLLLSPPASNKDLTSQVRQAVFIYLKLLKRMNMS